MFKGGNVCNGLVNDGTDVTVYSTPFVVGTASTFSMHLIWTETSATFATVVTMWASNKRKPDESDDADWVEIDADGGFDGFPGLTAGAMGTTGKDFVDVGNAGGIHYRLKFVRSGGAATIDCFVAMKDNA